MRKAVLFLPFLLMGCAETPVSSSGASSEKFPISSQESSLPMKVPEKIYLYEEGNVPYDGEESARKVFTGDDPALYPSFSAELHVDEDFPSIYLFHEKNDPTVPAKGGEALAEALSFFEVDSRFDLFQDEAGGDVALHGFGVTEELPEASRRIGNALSFLKER